MPSTARKDINLNIVPAFAEKFKEGDSILFVGVSRPFGPLYKQIFKDRFYVTVDINPNTNPDVVGDIEKCQMADKSFDGIVMIGVYEYLNDPQRAFAEIYRILKDDGWALFCVPGPGYYSDKPIVCPETANEVVKPMVVKEMRITYYKNDNPNYIHLFCQKK